MSSEQGSNKARSPGPDTQEALKAGSPRLAAALEQLAEGVIIADERGDIIYMNAAAHALHGKTVLGVGYREYAETYRLLTVDGAPYPPENLPLTRAVLAGDHVRDAYWRIERPDGSRIVAMGTASPVFDNTGHQIGAVLTLRDDTDRVEQNLALERATALKDMLLREIHHRVKNNLQLVSSLLSLQSRNATSEEASSALGDLSLRIDIIANVHRALYEAGETDTIEVVSYLCKLSRTSFANLVESFGASFEVGTAGACILPVEKATSLALAINELILNSLRHGFVGTSEPQIAITIKAGTEALTITYTDNGVGLEETADRDGQRLGLGEVLLNGLRRQLSATLKRSEANMPGFGVDITIPYKDNVVPAA